MNFVAVQLVAWASLGFWRDSEAAVTQSTEAVPYTLADLPGTDRLSIALLVPFALAGILWWVFRSTTIGYEIDTIGGNPRAAAFAGIRVRRQDPHGDAHHRRDRRPRWDAPAERTRRPDPQLGILRAVRALRIHRRGPRRRAFMGVIGGGLFIASMFYAGLVLQTKGLSVYIIFGIYGLILTGIALGEVVARYRLVRTGEAAVGEAVPA